MSDVYQISESDWGWRAERQGLLLRLSVFACGLISIQYLVEWALAVFQHRPTQFHLDRAYLFSWIAGDALVEWFGGKSRSKFEVEFSHGRLGFRTLGEIQPIYFMPGEIRLTEKRGNLVLPARLTVSGKAGFRRQTWPIPLTLPQFQELKNRLQEFAISN